jgi:general secretion pathway protein D
VLIQVLLAEVTLDSTRELGIEWNVTKTVEDAKLFTGTDFGVANDLKNFGGFATAVTGSDYNFLLRALDDEGRLEVLSRPQILTADNKPASINIGQRVPFVTLSRVTENSSVINSVEYQNVGVSLSVTPRIGADGAVRMEIGTTNSAISSSPVTVAVGVTAPIINERRAMTSVSVQSGQSIIIGGLISTSDDKRTKKIPYLGDIPLLGALFRSKTTISGRKELLILLTPQVLLGPSDAEDLKEEQTKHSTLKDQIQRDKVRDQLLEPLFPDRRSDAPEVKPGKTPAPEPEDLKDKDIDESI